MRAHGDMLVSKFKYNINYCHWFISPRSVYSDFFSFKMKYALFEFVDEKSCEIGETRWIRHEDATTFENVGWNREKEVMVAWPHEFAKVSKKIVKGSIDPMSVPTTTCVAKVIIFSGKCLLVFLILISEFDLFDQENEIPKSGRNMWPWPCVRVA